jgi:hypothetical protein
MTSSVEPTPDTTPTEKPFIHNDFLSTGEAPRTSVGAN